MKKFDQLACFALKLLCANSEENLQFKEPLLNIDSHCVMHCVVHRCSVYM